MAKAFDGLLVGEAILCQDLTEFLVVLHIRIPHCCLTQEEAIMLSYNKLAKHFIALCRDIKLQTKSPLASVGGDCIRSCA